MAPDKNIRQRKKSEKSSEPAQEEVKKDTAPADGEDDSKQRKQ